MFKTKVKSQEPTSPKKKKKTTIPSFGRRPSAREDKSELGLSIPAKFYGQLQVTQPRSDTACETALALLKARSLTSKVRKQRVTIELLPTQFVVKQSNCDLHSFAYADMAFIWSDPYDSRSCGLVFRRTDLGDNLYEFYGYKLERGPSRLIGALKHMFLNLPMNNGMENKMNEVTNEAKETNAVSDAQINNNDDADKPQLESKNELFVQDLLDLEEKLDTQMVNQWSPPVSSGNPQAAVTLLEWATQNPKNPQTTGTNNGKINHKASWATFDDPFELDHTSPSGLPRKPSWTAPDSLMDVFSIESNSTKPTNPVTSAPPPFVGNQWVFESSTQPAVTRPQWQNATSTVAPEPSWMSSSSAQHDFQAISNNNNPRNPTSPQRPNPFVNLWPTAVEHQHQKFTPSPTSVPHPPPVSAPFQFPGQLCNNFAGPLESTLPSAWY